MRIIHIITIIGNEKGAYQKLLEHLRYSDSQLVSWQDDRENKLTAVCLFIGTKRGFENAKNRALSFRGISISEK